jgi:hypothetical protein
MVTVVATSGGIVTVDVTISIPGALGRNRRDHSHSGQVSKHSRKEAKKG